MSTVRTPDRPRGIRPSRIIIYGLLVAFSIVYLLPVYVLIVGSLKTLREVNTTSIWTLPTGFNLGAWADALQPPLQNSGGIASGLANSLTMTIPAVAISSLWGSINGYILSKWRFRGSDTVFALLLFGMFIPYQAILIPLVNLLQQLHLYDSLIGLAITHIIYGIPITTLIFRNYYASIPTELVEAAKVDGASERQTFTRVVFPVMRPINVVIVVITTIEALRAFDIAYIINGGRNGLELLSTLITNNSISESSRVGFGSAIAVVLLVVSLGPIVAFLLRMLREEPR